MSPTVVATTGRALSDAVPISAAESLGYPTGVPAGVPDGSHVRDPRGSTWLITGGARASAGAQQWAALGRAAPTVRAVADADLARLPEVELPRTPLYPGALVRTQEGPVHHVDGRGVLHLVPDPAVLASRGWSDADVAVLPAGALDEAQEGPPLGLRDGSLVQTPRHVVAVVSEGVVRRLRDARQVAAYGYRGLPRRPVPDALLAHLREGELTGR